MFKFGLIKVTLFYMLCIAFVFLNTISFGYGVVIFCSGLFFLIKRNLAVVSVALCIFGLTLFQFNSIFPTSDRFENGYCKINKTIEATYNTKLFCDCKWENQNFKSILYFKSENFNPKVGETYFVNNSFSKLESSALFGEFSYSDYLNKKGIYFESTNVKAFHLRQISSANVVNTYQSKLLKSIDNILNKYFTTEEAGLIKALCFGNKSDVSKQKLETFRQAGLMHIIAVSGMHVGAIQFFLLFIMKRIFGKTPLSLRIQHGIVLVLLIAFAWLCQFSPSVVRSVFMFSVLFYVTISKRVILSVHVLFFTALAILLVQPLQLFDVGFQFSYLATFGLILCMNTVIKFGKRIKIGLLRWILQLSFISCIAQLFLSPLLFYYFGEIPIWFLIFNIPGFLFVSIELFLTFLFFLSYLLGGLFLDEIVNVISFSMDWFNALLEITDSTSHLFFHFKLNSEIELLWYSLALFLLIITIVEMKWRCLKYFFLSIILLVICKFNYNNNVKNRIEVLAWNTNSDQCVTMKVNKKIYFYSTYFPKYSQRLKNYASVQNSSLIHQPCSTAETEIESYLIHVNKTESDSAICILFNDNPAITQYLDKNFKHYEILFFGQPSYKEKELFATKNYLSYGPTSLDIRKNIVFYP